MPPFPRNPPNPPPLPGDRVWLRRRQYLVEEVDAGGSSDLTRVRGICLDDDDQGRAVEVLWEIEAEARVLQDPTKSPVPVRFESARRLSAYVHTIRWNAVSEVDPGRISAPWRCGIAPLPHQCVPLHKALAAPRANLLVADDVGLGKTIEAGLIISELTLRQRLDMVVVVAPATVVLQWRDEMQRRFGLSFEIYNRAFVTRCRTRHGFTLNPWRAHSRYVISYQMLRRPEHRDPLLQCLGARAAASMVVFDEAHTVAPSSAHKYAVDSQLTHLARELAPRFENRLFLTATPHNGHSNSFSALLELVDPLRFSRGVAVTDPKQLTPVMVRRRKSELTELGEGSFPVRRLVEVTLRHEDGIWWADAGQGGRRLGHGADEELVLAQLLRSYGKLLDGRGAAGRLVVTTLQKRLLSSVPAFAHTLRVHAAALGLQGVVPSEAPADALDELGETYGQDEDGAASRDVHDASARFEGSSASANELVAEMLRVACGAGQGGKLLALVDWVSTHLCPSTPQGGRRWSERRLIVFTEYAHTQRYLEQALLEALAISAGDGRIMLFHGGMSDEEREEVARAFTGPPTHHPVRILVATDAAREGINLQAHCADLIHFDIPWNPARLEQRNGRIDRALQPEPEVRCLYFTLVGRAEDRVLSTLVRKLDNIEHELGPLSTLLVEQLQDAVEVSMQQADTGHIDGVRPTSRVVDLASSEQHVVGLKSIQAEISVSREAYQQSLKVAKFDAQLLRAAVDEGLGVLGAGPLRNADAAAGQAVIPSMGPAWTDVEDLLRHPKARAESAGRWRARALRSASFEPSVRLGDEQVHLHLQHPWVERVLNGLRTCAGPAGSVCRAAIIDGGEVPQLLLLGRLSLFGPGAPRLHDELLGVGFGWQLDGPLTPLNPEQTAGAMARFDSVLAEAGPAPTLTAELGGRIGGRAPLDLAAAWPALEARARLARERATEALQRRRAEELERLREVTAAQRTAIEDAVTQGAQVELSFTPDESGQRQQLARDLRYLRDRLGELDKQSHVDAARTLDRYRVVSERLQPVALVYLWP